jgi:hypothetical protein
MDAVLEEKASQVAPPREILPEGARKFVAALIAKYGTDYAAMARDHKLNYLQHTPKQLERKVSVYQRLVASTPT